MIACFEALPRANTYQLRTYERLASIRKRRGANRISRCPGVHLAGVERLERRWGSATQELLPLLSSPLTPLAHRPAPLDRELHL